MKGLRCEVYRPADGNPCTSGPSARYAYLVLVGEGIPESDEASEDCPAVRYVPRQISGKPAPYVKPVDPPGEGRSG